MQINKDNWLFLVLSVIFIFASFIFSNILIDRIIKQPFLNGLTFQFQKFSSPVTIILFTSAIIWMCAEIIKFILKTINKQQNQEDNGIDFQQDNNQLDVEESNQKMQDDISKKKQIQSEFEKQQSIEKIRIISSQQRIQIKNLPKIQIFKIVVPNFISIACFLYGLTYLSFHKIMIFKTLSKLGLLNLYESLFEEGTNKCSKFVMSMAAFIGFAIFNYSNTDTADNQLSEKLHKKEALHGYLFAIAMTYVSLVKNAFERKVQKYYGRLSSIDKIIVQSKSNFFFAYFLALFMNQQIYGFVFVWFHFQFTYQICILSFLLLIGFFCKKYLQNNFSAFLTNFIIILQKCCSLIIIILISGIRMSLGQIVGIIIIVLIGFAAFISQFAHLKNKKNQPQTIQQECQTKQLYQKNDDIHNQDEKKSLRP